MSDSTKMGRPLMTEPGLGGLFSLSALFAVGGNKETKKKKKKMRHWCYLKGVLKPWVEVLNEAGSVREIFI